jgi:tRNA(Arg) A34 adenosine deaminase TadA
MGEDLLPLRWPLTRRLLLLAGATAAGIAAALAVRLQLPDEAGAGIDQPASRTPAAFLERAFEMRRLAERSGDQPHGAVVVKDNRIVGHGPSRVIVNADPTAHAEIEAIRDAARRLRSRRLDGCILYSSSAPCPMCEAAAYWAGIARLHAGPGGEDRGAPRLGRC